jgi:hypothetical protein
LSLGRSRSEAEAAALACVRVARRSIRSGLKVMAASDHMGDVVRPGV